jgi:hypothetical protein
MSVYCVLYYVVDPSDVEWAVVTASAEHIAVWKVRKDIFWKYGSFRLIDIYREV